MKLTIERDALHGVLNKVARFAPRRESIPILRCVRLVAENDTLRLAATNSIQFAALTIDATIDEAGAVAVDAERLARLAAGAASGSQIQLVLKSNQLHFTAGRTRARLATLPADDFPEMEPPNDGGTLTVPADILLAALAKAQPAISTDEARYYLCGVHMHAVPKAETIRCVATDGHRLHVAHVTPETREGDWPSVIIPRELVGHLPRLFDDDAPLTLTANDTRIRVTQGKTVVTSRLIEGTFPDYQRLIPAKANEAISAARAELHTIVERVMPINNERSRTVHLRCTDSELQLAATDKDLGDAVVDRIEAQIPDDQPEIGFNGGYLAQALAALAGDKVTLQFSDSASPAVLRGDDDEDLCVIMPMKVGAFPELPEED